MKIERNVNGQLMEFELTPEELSGAYYEQEHIFDIQDIRDKLNGEMDPGEFEEEHGVPVELVLNNDSLLEEMAYELRHNIDKYGQSWEAARDDAIRDILDQRREELCAEQPEQAAELPFPGLPETCYGILASTGDVIIIKNGESGYYKTDIDTGNKEDNIALVDEFNEKAGISKAQRAAMEAGSMFGWNCPAANPEMYDENGKRKYDSLASKIASAEQERTEPVSFPKEHSVEIDRE